MGWLTTIKKGIQGINFYLCLVGMFLLIPMMLLTATDVIGRAVWAWPVPGAVELSSYLLAVFILLGVAYTHQVKGHVCVSMLVSRLPEQAGIVLDVITTLLSLFILSILAWQGWVVGIEERTVSDMLRIPQLPFRLLVSLAGVFICLELLIDLSASVKKLVRR
jgi:TRAP-type C4-dicarboxylate transport system permease small subunit